MTQTTKNKPTRGKGKAAEKAAAESPERAAPKTPDAAPEKAVPTTLDGVPASAKALDYTLENPFAAVRAGLAVEPETEYERAVARGGELIAKAQGMGGPARILQQHAKGRMTVVERMRVLTDKEPNILFQN